MFKEIEVVAAIIVKDGNVLSPKRLNGVFAGQWEFPGGKVEPNETTEDALVREIKEELCAEIIVKEFLCTVKYHINKVHLFQSSGPFVLDCDNYPVVQAFEYSGYLTIKSYNKYSGSIFR